MGAKIRQLMNEALSKKMVLDEESFFEGYDFTTNGSEMQYADITDSGFQLNPRSVNVKWKLKFEMGHIGIYSADIQIRSIVAATIANDSDGSQPTPLNLNGFEHIIKKVKNPEVDELQIFLNGLFIDVERRQIQFEFTI